MTYDMAAEMGAFLFENACRMERIEKGVATMDRRLDALAELVGRVDLESGDAVQRIELLSGAVSSFVGEAQKLREAFGMMTAVASYGAEVPE